jgi:uncharacterized membrane protein YhaH (DUF805 family)
MKWFLKVVNQYADFNGRARRTEYWMFSLMAFIFSFILGFMDGLTGMYDEASGYGLLSGLFSLALLLPSIAVGVRRCHDVGKSGWFILVPIYNFILMVTNGEEGENKYGPDPKSE